MQHFDDTPDASRPRNPWPRLMALGGVLLATFLAAGACLVAFVNTGAEPEIRIALTEIEPSVPRFEPVTNWGADSDRFTYGIWVAQIPGVGTRAFMSREVNSTCHLQWQATERVGAVTGVFRDRCNGNAYTIEGVAIEGSSPRNLDQFAVNTGGGEIVVDLSVLRIGTCTAGTSSDPICSPEQEATTRSVPRNVRLPDDFARR